MPIEITREDPATLPLRPGDYTVYCFEGSSDDTFGDVSTNTADDYDNCASGDPIEWVLTAPNGEQLLVFGQYCPGVATGWVIGVSRFDGNDGNDDTPIPDWTMRFVPGSRPYTPRLIVEAPRGTTMVCLQRGGV